MYTFILKYFLLSFLILSNLLSEEFIQLKKNITSLLNTTDVIDFNDHIVVSSNGGVYIYDDEDSFSLNEKLNVLNISSLSVYENYLWIGSKGVGEIQIFDNNFNIYSNIEYPQFDEILDITYTDQYAFAVVVNDQNYMVVQYNIENLNNPFYLNVFSSFPITFEKIND